MFSFYQIAAILDLWVNIMLYRQTDVRIGILVDDIPEKVSLYVMFGALVHM